MHDKNSKVIKIYATGLKGLKTIEGIASVTRDVIVCLGRDRKVIHDFSDEIIRFCERENLTLIEEDDASLLFGLAIASGWQKMIYNIPSSSLIVFHDSLLPKYRGFNPLVSALLNEESYVGVTALEAADEYDKGNIFLQRKIKVTYPVKIKKAIEEISEIYFKLAVEIYHRFILGVLSSEQQQDEFASYSLWRDEEDYAINWNHSAQDILLLINTVGYPYKGASTIVDGKLLRIYSATVLPDVMIENRAPGKIIFFKDSRPVVVCGANLLKIDEFKYDNGEDVLNLKFRTRFK